MRNFAIGILLVILLSIVIEPLVEMMEIGREKVILSTTLNNACRATVLSLEYEKLRDLDAKIEVENFVDKFSEVFQEAMNLSELNRNNNIITFTSNDGKYNNIIVEVNIEQGVDPFTDQEVSKVRLKAESVYKFKTKYLKQVAGSVPDYSLHSERIYVFSVKN